MRMFVGVSSLASILVVMLAGTAQAGEQSEELGPVSKLLGDGYGFAAGGPLGPKETSRVPVNKDPPLTYSERHFRQGTVYLVKGKDVAVCHYVIVDINPAFESYGPGSTCYRIK
jgi:hypothetical protein